MFRQVNQAQVGQNCSLYWCGSSTRVRHYFDMTNHLKHLTEINNGIRAPKF